jgi:MFS transporter, PAT family, solute carrier family 33 (acetyl-CoA transportor), member 1
MPIILRDHLSYSQWSVVVVIVVVVIITSTHYPYFLKLWWLPIVDSVSFPSIGCRKSWIILMQFMLGLIMLLSSTNAQNLLDKVCYK